MATDRRDDPGRDTRARAFLADVLAALEAGEREVACEYVLAKAGRRDLGGEVSDTRNSAECTLKYLAGILRDDMQMNGGSYTDHLRDEANGWIVRGAVFGVAQNELEVRYADFRKCARWKPTPFSGLGTRPVVDFREEDERAVALRLRDALRRSIETLERVPKPRTAELVDKPSRPDSPSLLAARLVYELHTVFLPMICIAYNLGGMDNVVASLVQVRTGFVVAALLSPVAWWAVMYKFRGTHRPTARATQNIVKFRKKSRQWSLLWKTVLALTERIVDDEDMDEAVVVNIRRIFDLVDTRMMPFQHPLGLTSPGRTILEFIHGSMTTVPNGDELMAEIIARTRPFVQPEIDMDHTSDEASTAIANHDTEDQQRAELDALLSDACNDLGSRDPFFSILGPASYAGISRLRIQPATHYADELVNAIDDMIAALWELEPIPATLQNFVRNTHLRLAWIGGLGHAQVDIVAQIELYRHEPTREKLQHLERILGHYLSALCVEPPPSFRDLLVANLRKHDRIKLILTETFKICRFALVCLPLLIVPMLDSRIVEGIFALACALLLRAVATSGVAPLEGLYDLATGYHRNRDVHTAANVAADLERLARYHILGWKALRVAIGESASGAEGDDAIVRMLMDNIVSAAKPSILVPLVEALNGKEAYGVKGKPYSQKEAVRKIVDARYPAFASGERGRSKVS
ncbi:hypothetical protein EV121DRAFT_214209 [Schizophyllum commune]